MLTATCVECDEEIEINDRPRRGLRIICPYCGVQLEITSTVPLELDLPIENEDEEDDVEWDDKEFRIPGDEEFDWDDDDFDDDDDDNEEDEDEDEEGDDDNWDDDDDDWN